MNISLPREGVIGEDGYRFPVRIYYEDTDAAGVVYHTNYFKFAERARTEMLRQLGIEQEALRSATGLAFAVRRCSADFILPARLDDDLVVVTRVLALSGASVEFKQEVLRANIILVRLTFQIVCLGRNNRAHRLPAEFRAAFQTRMELTAIRG
jgi:acyl-CoA thioester hydrolase